MLSNFETTLLIIDNRVLFNKMYHLIECADIGYSDMVFLFDTQESLERAKKILREHNVSFKEEIK